MPPASLKVAFLFGKSVCWKSLSPTTFPRILLVTICKRPHSKTPHCYLTILKSLSKSNLGKIIKLTKSSNLPRQGLRILVTSSEPSDIFKWGLLPIALPTVVVMKNDPKFQSHTKRNATFKKITEFVLAAWDFSYFVKTKGRCVLRLVSILR